MTDLQTLIRTVHELGSADKLVLRDILDGELEQDSTSAAAKTTRSAANPLLGLLKDEPDLADQITESAMRLRETRPLRSPRE